MAILTLAITPEWRGAASAASLSHAVLAGKRKIGNEMEILHDDCLNAMRQLPDGCIDAVITDPPHCSGSVT